MNQPSGDASEEGKPPLDDLVMRLEADLKKKSETLFQNRNNAFEFVSRAVIME